MLSNLLVFTENYALGGGNRYVIDTINAVADFYDRVYLVSNSGGIYKEDASRLNCDVVIQSILIFSRNSLSKFISFLPELIQKLIVKVLRPLDVAFFFLNFIGFMLLLRRMKPSAVISCNGGYPAAFSTLALILAARMSQTPCALTVVSMPTKRSWLLFVYERLVDHMVGRSVNTIIVNANAIKHALVSLRGFPEGKINVVYNGLEEMPEINSEKFSGNDGIVIGCVARLDRGKGVLFLLEAFGALAKKYNNISLTLVGHGNASKELSRRIGKLGLHKRVRLLGYYNGNIHELLLSFDIYVFPSLWEGFPYSVLEAMRAGCAIVSSNVGGIPEAIHDREEGLLVTPGSVESLKHAIENMILDEAFRNRLRERAKQKFNNNFSLSVMYGNMVKVLIQAGLLTDI